jgi:hypothetical protein
LALTYRKAPICGERHEYFMRAGGSVRRHQHFFSKGSFEMYNSIKTTLLGGVIFLVPVVVLLAIIEKGLGYAQKAVVPVANALFKGDFTQPSSVICWRLFCSWFFVSWPVSLRKRPSRASMLTRWRNQCSSRFRAMMPRKASFSVSFSLRKVTPRRPPTSPDSL